VITEILLSGCSQLLGNPQEHRNHKVLVVLTVTGISIGISVTVVTFQVAPDFGC